MKTAVAENSLKTYRALQAEGYLPPAEAKIFNLFKRDTKMSRQQIEANHGIKINCVSGRVKSLLERGLLVEDGNRIDPQTHKPQALLRLADSVPVQGQLC